MSARVGDSRIGADGVRFIGTGPTGRHIMSNQAKASQSLSQATSLAGPAESRRHPRIKLPAMYTLVRVRPAGCARYRWTGYIYDISQSGMRLELDDALPEGTPVEVRVMLPGNDQQTTFFAAGKIIRNHDEDEPFAGPTRMGMQFDTFPILGDEHKLASYIHKRLVPYAVQDAKPAQAA